MNSITEAVPRSSGAEESAPLRIFSAIDAAVILFLGAALFLYPWHYDEGWMDLTILNAKTTGTYSYVIDNGNAPYTFVKPWFALLNLFCFPSLGPGHVFLMRLPGLVFSLIGWAAIRAALRHLSLDSVLAQTMAAFVWAIFGAEFFVNVRLEAAYGPALAIALLLSLEWIRAARLGLLLSGFGLTALVIGTHPVAALIPLVLLVTLPFGRPAFTFRDRLWIAAAFAVTIGVSAMMVLWDQSPAAFLHNLQAAANRTHSLSWRDEWARYLDLGFRIPPLAFSGFMGFLAMLLVMFSDGITPRVRAVIFLQVLLVAAFLLFYPAKWHYYLAAYAPWFSISWAQLGETLAMRWRRLPMLRGTAVLAAACVSVTIAAQRSASSFDPTDASLLRSSVLEPIFGFPRTEQEKVIDGIPEIVKNRRVAAELYMFPILDLFSLHRASFDDDAPPDFMITHLDELPPALTSVTSTLKWRTTEWTLVTYFRFEGETVVVVSPVR